MAQDAQDIDFSVRSSQRIGHIAYVLDRSRDGPNTGKPASGLASAFDLFTKVLAPTTLLTALAYYFGRQFTYARADYFGIDASVLGFSTQDYVVRSLDALFIPMGALVSVGLLALRCHATISRGLQKTRPQRSGLRRLSTSLIVVSLPILLMGIVGAVHSVPFEAPYLLVPISSGLGLSLLSYALYLRSRTTALESRQVTAPWISLLTRILVGGFLVLSVFWTTSEYARALGTGRAEALDVKARPQAIVYSAKRLHLGGSSIIEGSLKSAKSAYRFRYSGLRLLLESNGRFFLLPEDWSHDHGRVFVIPDDKSVRLEFKAAPAS